MEHAKTDKRIVAAALLGSMAEGGDRWSDLDLTFGVAKDAKVSEVLEDWTKWFLKEFNASKLFDLPSGSAIYRVFLTPTNLQLDLSFSPENEFAALGPQFKPLFGKYLEKYQTANPSPDHIFGLAVHHLVRARICIERGRFWQAEYWINAARDETLTLMCLERGLRLREGRGYDELPKELLEPFKKTLVGLLDRDGLIRAFGGMVDCFLENSKTLQERTSRLEKQLRALREYRLE